MAINKQHLIALYRQLGSWNSGLWFNIKDRSKPERWGVAKFIKNRVDLIPADTTEVICLSKSKPGISTSGWSIELKSCLLIATHHIERLLNIESSSLCLIKDWQYLNDQS